MTVSDVILMGLLILHLLALYYLERIRLERSHLKSLLGRVKDEKELLDELNSAKQLVKELCDEWNEDCEKECSSYGHDEKCASVNLAVAKRNLNNELTAARIEIQTLKLERETWGNEFNAVMLVRDEARKEHYHLHSELTAAQAKLKAQEELLGEADKLLIDCWYMTSENFWHRNPINLFREKLRTARGRA